MQEGFQGKRANDLFNIIQNRKRQRTSNSTGTPVSRSIGFDNFVYYLDERQNCPYYGWLLYFFNEEYAEDSATVQKIRILENFFKRMDFSNTGEMWQTFKSINVDINLLFNDEFLLNNWSSFRTELKYNPRRTLKCLQVALHQTIAKNNGGYESLKYNLKEHPRVNVSIENYASVSRFDDLDASADGTLVAIKGYVTKISRVRIVSRLQVYVCEKCGLKSLIRRSVGDDAYACAITQICKVCGRNERYRDLKSPYARTDFVQAIELYEEANLTTMQKAIQVELTDDLINTCLPGDVVKVTGILKISTKAESGLIADKRKSTETSTILAVNITQASDNFDTISVMKLRNTPDLFNVLVQSLCPEIPGQEIIKAALLLSLFSGSEDNDRVNVLIVTDAGCASSQLLQFCCNVAHRGIYVDGHEVPSYGLDTTIKHAGEVERSTVEVGALSLAANGCCAIDGFQKTSQYHMLINGMRTGGEDVIDASCKHHISAAPFQLVATPSLEGAYNKSKRLDENVNFRKTLLSNFHLVLIMSNDVNEICDRVIVNHKMNLHRNFRSLSSFLSSSSGNISRKSRERYMTTPGDGGDVVPQALFKAYIFHARQCVNSEVSSAALTILTEYLNKIGGDPNRMDHLLCTLIKLTQARAKVDLRATATEVDARQVLQIYEHTRLSAIDAFSVPGFMHVGRSIGKLNKNMLKVFLRALSEQTRVLKKDIISMGELKNIAEKNNITDFLTLVSKLNEEGYLLKCSPKTFRIVTNYA